MLPRRIKTPWQPVPQHLFLPEHKLQLEERECSRQASDEAVAAATAGTEPVEAQEALEVPEALAETVGTVADSLGETERLALTTQALDCLGLDPQMAWMRRTLTIRSFSRTRPRQRSPSSTTGRAVNDGAK